MGLRFVLIGLGNIADIHARSINDIDGAELYGVCTSNEIKGQKYAQKYGVKKIYSSIDEVAQDSLVDVVCILTPSGLHSDMGAKLAGCKKHIIVEKPIDVSIEKADILIKACEDNGVALGVISQHRMDNSTRRIKDAVDKGSMGSLLFGNAHIKWFRSQEYYDSAKWRGTWELDGGGALMNQGIHTIDLLLHIMGDVKSVYAKYKTVGHDRIEVEDAATAIIEFKNGALGTIVGSTAVYPGMPARLEINGTKGSAVIEGDELVYFNTKEDVKVAEEGLETITGASNPTDIDYESHKRQIREIITSINNDSKIPCDGYEGRRALELILAIYRSQNTGKTIYFE